MENDEAVFHPSPQPLEIATRFPQSHCHDDNGDEYLPLTHLVMGYAFWGQGHPDMQVFPQIELIYLRHTLEVDPLSETRTRPF